MSTGAQIDLDWAGVDASPNTAQAASKPSPSLVTETKDLTDEQILGIEPVGSDGTLNSSVIPSEARNLSSIADGSGDQPERDSSGINRPRNDKTTGAVAGAENGGADSSADNTAQTEVRATEGMPAWMAAAAADPRHSAEAQGLWREHQEFRAAFASAEEARAVKELLPGGVRDVLSLRQATQSVERIDAALFSGDARAQAEVVAEIARANPAAFRSLFAEAAKFLGGMGGGEAGGREAGSRDAGGRDAGGRDAGGRDAGNFDASALSESGAGARNSEAGGSEPGAGDGSHEDDRGLRDGDEGRDGRHHSGRGHRGSVPPGSQGAGDPPPGDPDMAGGSVVSARASGFDAAAYAAFERSTNDVVARDVRGSIHDTLSRVMPDGVAEGAARRIGEDIFHEVHRALAADRTLSEQVAAVLRERRFGPAEQQRVSALLAGRARQLVPSVARRVIGEWTTSVLSTARNKAARQAAAASRVDIAGQGGSLDSTPLRSQSGGAREVNYASMSDEEILGM